MQLHLYVADQVDTLSSGKTLLFGLYADRVILLHIPPDDPGPSSERPHGAFLSFLVCISGLSPGEHEVRIAILDPSGKQVMTAAPQAGSTAVSVGAGQSVNIVLPAAQITFTQLGYFAVVVDVDGTPVESGFEIRAKQ